ncbi:E3 ubiquitin-protein ligase MARCHF8-like isoform X2 [Dreissena polymorpha]|uniref:RING-CH-type domain-containing protein n=1 Tax=Dreissena polymorpha TaxID=45954 RepID=A0A9D4F773_DREPO|nr:E3 ubiquitin-protein ligase MARCHF8-like isoform X2 [Dreissena polymorpha]KAH3793283.1 hypothetical protein DPMN_146790 [Dreissena polymorpha]
MSGISRPLPLSPVCSQSMQGISDPTSPFRPLPLSPAFSQSTPGPLDDKNNNSVFNYSGPVLCRICHDDEKSEPLWSPCHCRGTIGLLHMSCLERWLGCSNTTKCEVCAFQFCVEKKPRPWKWYMREPSLRRDRRLLCREVLLTATLGLIVLIVDALCFTFADRLRAETNIGPAAVLIVIGMMTVTLYVAWLLISVRRIRAQIRKWHKVHHVIAIRQNSSDPKEPKRKVKIFCRFPVPKALRRKTRTQSSQQTESDADVSAPGFLDLNGSLPSYNAAMFNPVGPKEPLLEHEHTHQIIFLEESSPSVVSLDDFEESQSFYLAPKVGTTLTFNSKTGLVKETRV